MELIRERGLQAGWWVKEGLVGQSHQGWRDARAGSGRDWLLPRVASHELLLQRIAGVLKQRQLADLWPEHKRPPALPPGPAQLAVRDLRQGAESVGSLYRGPPEGSVNNALHIAPAPLGEGAGGGGAGRRQ